MLCVCVGLALASKVGVKARKGNCDNNSDITIM